eukprot:3462513-Prymnesium_polylepis.2
MQLAWLVLQLSCLVLTTAWSGSASFARPPLRALPPIMVAREWRVFGVEVPFGAADHPTISYNQGLSVSEPLLKELAKRLGFDAEKLPVESVKLVRRSLDARPQRSNGRRGRRTGKREVRWSYVVDVTLDVADARRLKAQAGRLVPATQERAPV